MGTHRLPVQIGTSALWSGARAISSLGAATLLLALTYSALFHPGVASGWSILGLLAAFLLVRGGFEAQRSWRSRPSDALLSAEQLRVEGGPHHGLVLAWTELDPAGCDAPSLKETRYSLSKLVADGVMLALSNGEERMPEEEVEVRRLRLSTRSGQVIELAVAEQPAEQRQVTEERDFVLHVLDVVAHNLDDPAAVFEDRSFG